MADCREPPQSESQLEGTRTGGSGGRGGISAWPALPIDARGAGVSRPNRELAVSLESEFSPGRENGAVQSLGCDEAVFPSALGLGLVELANVPAASPTATQQPMPRKRLMNDTRQSQFFSARKTWAAE